MSATATMTSKGQVTIPSEVRAALGLRPGSRLVFRPTTDGRYELEVRTGSVHELAGILRHHLPDGAAPMTLEQMDDAVADAAGGVDQSDPD